MIFINSLIICNTGDNSISKLSLDSMVCEKIKFSSREGPRSIWIDKNKAYIANGYSNSISIIDIESFKEEENIYIGAHPNDLLIFNDLLYVSCADSNMVCVYDLIEKKLILEILVNDWPYSIEISKELELLFVSNFKGNSISIIDLKKNIIIKEIEVLKYPTKSKVSNDNKLLFVCESFMGHDMDGFMEIFDLETLTSIKKVSVGRVPIDILEDDSKIYVSNLGDGTISIIDKISFTNIDSIILNGMPKSMIKYNDNLFVTDYLNSRLLYLNLINKDIKAITVGREPSAMTLY